MPAGDSTGTVHLLSLASPAAAALVSSQQLHAADITSLSFAAGGSGGAQLLLAAGSRRGGVKVLQQEPDGLAVLASLADHKAAVTGVMLGSGGTALHTAAADGRRLAYRWDSAAGRMQLVAQAAVPRCSFVGLAPALDGQAAVAASRAGRLYWDAAGKEVSVPALQKTQGEAQGTGREALRAPCSSAAPAQERTTSNVPPLLFHPFRRRAGCLRSGPLALPAGLRHHPQPAAGPAPCGRHGCAPGSLQGGACGGRCCDQGGSRRRSKGRWRRLQPVCLRNAWQHPITILSSCLATAPCAQVLISPDARWVITAGDDAALRSFVLPASTTASCRDAAQVCSGAGF